MGADKVRAVVSVLSLCAAPAARCSAVAAPGIAPSPPAAARAATCLYGSAPLLSLPGAPLAHLVRFWPSKPQDGPPSGAANAHLVRQTRYKCHLGRVRRAPAYSERLTALAAC